MNLKKKKKANKPNIENYEIQHFIVLGLKC